MPRTDSIRTGSSTYVDYAYEPTYGGSLPTGTTRSLFGKDQKVNGLEFSNNQMAVAQLYRPTYESYLYNKNTGGCSVEYILSNPFMFSSVFSNPVKDNSEYTWSAWFNDTAKNTLNRDIRSMNVRFGIERFGTNDFLQTATGVMCNSLSLKTAIDQPVTVSQNLTWSQEDADDDAELPESEFVDDSSFLPYNFVHGTVSYIEKGESSGETIGTIQDIDLSIATDAEHLWGLGSETAVDAWRKIFKMTGKVNLAFRNQDYYNYVIDREEQGTDAKLVLNFSRPDDTSNSIRIELDGVSLGSRRVTYAPGEPVFEDFDYQARECVVTANTTVSDFAPVQ